MPDELIIAAATANASALTPGMHAHAAQRHPEL